MRWVVLVVALAVALASQTYQSNRVLLDKSVKATVRFVGGGIDQRNSVVGILKEGYSYSFNGLPNFLKVNGDALEGYVPQTCNRQFIVTVSYRSANGKRSGAYSYVFDCNQHAQNRGNSKQTNSVTYFNGIYDDRSRRIFTSSGLTVLTPFLSAGETSSFEYIIPQDDSSTSFSQSQQIPTSPSQGVSHSNPVPAEQSKLASQPSATSPSSPSLDQNNDLNARKANNSPSVIPPSNDLNQPTQIQTTMPVDSFNSNSPANNDVYGANNMVNQNTDASSNMFGLSVNPFSNFMGSILPPLSNGGSFSAPTTPSQSQLNPSPTSLTVQANPTPKTSQPQTLSQTQTQPQPQPQTVVPPPSNTKPSSPSTQPNSQVVSTSSSASSASSSSSSSTSTTAHPIAQQPSTASQTNAISASSSQKTPQTVNTPLETTTTVNTPTKINSTPVPTAPPVSNVPSKVSTPTTTNTAIPVSASSSSSSATPSTTTVAKQTSQTSSASQFTSQASPTSLQNSALTTNIFGSFGVNSLGTTSSLGSLFGNLIVDQGASSTVSSSPATTDITCSAANGNIFPSAGTVTFATAKSIQIDNTITVYIGACTNTAYFPNKSQFSVGEKVYFDGYYTNSPNTYWGRRVFCQC